MVWAFILFVVIFVWFLCMESDFGLAFSMAIIAGLGGGLVVALMVGAIWAPGTHYEHARPVALQSMADGGMNVHGTFFLGSGTVNSSSVYTWYEKTDSNTYVQRNADVDISRVHYLPPGQHPYYIRNYNVDNVKPGLKAFKIVLSEADTYYDSYDFYVPRGSIIQSYRLDSQ